MAEIGFASLVLTLLMALYSLAAGLYGVRPHGEAWRESAARSLIATLGLVTVSSCCLLYLLLTNDFRYQYVYESTSTVQPFIYHISAFWMGQAGSILFWLWCLALFSAILVVRPGALGRDAPYAFVILAALQAAFVVILVAGANPFAPAEAFYTEGFGGNPMLENPGMIYHPPAILAAYAISSIPFAWLVAGLIGGRVADSRWLRGLRPWVIMSWLFLTVGILLGAQWAYVELGWGGYWGWDPVENASLIPWLVATPLLHSLMMQERRGMFRMWNAVMISAMFLLCIFATWVTRGGVIGSVHAFGQSVVGNLFLLTLIALIIYSISLLRRHRAQLKSGYEVEDMGSREAMFLYTAFLFCGSAGLLFLGTIFPALTEAFTGQKIEWGTEGYAGIARVLGPLFLVLLGVCPLMSWRRFDGNRFVRSAAIPVVSSVVIGLVVLVLSGHAYAALAFALTGFAFVTVIGEFFSGWRVRVREGEGSLIALTRLVARNRRRYGGYLVHLGVLLMFVGITAQSLYQQRQQVSLDPGQSADLGGFRLTYVNFRSVETGAKDRLYAQIDVYRDNRKVDTLWPERNFHHNNEHWLTEVALRPRLLEDLYVMLLDVDESGLATFDIVINPLMNWLWIGTAVASLASILAVWPARRPLKTTTGFAVEPGGAS